MKKISLKRFLKERRLRRAFEPLRIRLQEELGYFLQQNCQLVPAQGKGGYDRLFYVETNGQRTAMMRVRNLQADAQSHSPSGGIRRTLTADERLDYEWAAYSALSGKKLSPQPVWRSDDAIVCSYYPFKRVAEVLKKDRQLVWNVLPPTFALVREMHTARVVHMDLNLGNMLVELDTYRLVVIDFEYAPAERLTFEQACLCDYLRLINDFIRPRRGGRELRKDIARFNHVLQDGIPEQVKQANFSQMCMHFPNIMHDKKILHLLESIFCPR